AHIARSGRNAAVLAAWAQGPQAGAAALRAALGASGVEPPDTAALAWGQVMGSDEADALEIVERALGDAVAAGTLLPGRPRWRQAAEALTEQVLTRPLDFPPGQTLAGMVTTERVGAWIDSARHPLHREWRSLVANRLLHPVEPPADPAVAVAPLHWLLELAARAGGAELTQSNYLARATVLAAVERFGWWRWSKAPRSESDVHQLGAVRDAATRLRLVRRRGRRLLLTRRGRDLLEEPGRLWAAVAAETEDSEDFTRMLAELVGLRLLQGRVEVDGLRADLTPILAAQGWSTSAGPITPNQLSSAVWRPVGWWRMFGALLEEEPTWEFGTGRRLTPHTLALDPDGERMVLAYLRSRAAGPRARFSY
ncbi:MAG: hypothetical protein QOK40_2419, partial [Miltoncostaeaceae bacterium]|nr:hypothetical protein [Miltoncostaeaceae bacterium]